MPVNNILVLTDLNPILARLDAIELRLNGTPPPPIDPPPIDPPPIDPPPIDPPPIDPPPSGELNLGDVVVEAGQTWPPADVTTIRLRSLDHRGTFRLGQPITIITKNEPGAGRVYLDGVLDVAGSPKAGFIRLANELKAGDLTLTLVQPAFGWQAGDRLLIPDTRIYRPDNGIERPTIASISADLHTVTLTAPLAFDHPGGRNIAGVLEHYPVVGNTSRSIVIKSESATGVRGYLTIGPNATGQFRNTQLAGLSQARLVKDDPLNDRPAVRLAGTKGLAFTGNSIFCPLDPMPFRWGLVLDDTRGNTIAGNVLYNWAGAGLMTCSGLEDDFIDGNFVCRITKPDGVDRPDDWGSDLGIEGSAFWFRGPFCRVTNNIAANTARYGFQFYFRFAPDPIVNHRPITLFDGNESMGSYGGLSYWWVGCQDQTPTNAGPSVFKGLKVWNHRGYAVFPYESADVTIDGLTVRSDPWNLIGGVHFGDYFAHNFTLVNSDIQGCQHGVQPSTNCGGTFLIKDTFLHNTCDVDLQMLYTSSHTPDLIPPRRVELRNVRYGPMAGRREDGNGTAQIARWPHADGDVMHWVQLDQVFVYDHNGTPGDNFKVYLPEQLPNAILQESVPWGDGTMRVIGCPEKGLTNAVAMVKHGVAMCGEIAPADAKPRAGIVGIVK